MVRARSAYGIARFRLRSAVLRHVPLQTSNAIARWHGRRYYAKRRDGFHKRAVDMAWRLGVSVAQADAWLERYYELASCDQLERHLFWRMSVEEIDQLIEIRGLQHLDAALAAGRGAILCSGHSWGHFTLFTALALRGYPLSILGFAPVPGREARVIQLEANHRNAFLRRRLGAQLLRMSEFGVAVKAQRALSENRVLTIEVDQSHSEPRVPHDFLGEVGYFPTGHVRLAEASGAPLLHFWLHRGEHGWLRQVGEIGPPYYATEGTEAAVRHCAELIERSVRRDPPSWSPWLYRRRFVWEPSAELPAGKLRPAAPVGV